ncbi:MAG: ketopantoate reductase family protein [Anaerolineae bacterium]|nr:ketopantoate reductase family protein [Anaerolineae bacterium]
MSANPTPTVVILGAGAIGAAYASKFYDMNPACITLVAAGERYQRLKTDGLVVNGQHYVMPVITPEDTAPPADLVIVALKHHHLIDAVYDLKHRVGDHTVILSVMNGLDSEDMLGAVYGAERVLYAIAVGIDAQRTGSTISYSKLGRITFGEADNTTLSERVRWIQALLARADIGYETPADMIRAMWWKFMVNVGINQTSAVLGAPYRVFQTSPHAQAIMEAAMREVIALAQATRVNLSASDIEEWYGVLNTLHPDGKTSMLQDVEAGRKTEVEIFAGKVVRLGQEYGIPTPVNETLLHAICVIEERCARPSGI